MFRGNKRGYVRAEHGNVVVSGAHPVYHNRTATGRNRRDICDFRNFPAHDPLMTKRKRFVKAIMMATTYVAAIAFYIWDYCCKVICFMIQCVV
jgi:hypothetical protein